MISHPVRGHNRLMTPRPTDRRSPPRGTTLIEVMLVVVIIGIISSLAIPRILYSAARARRTEATNMVHKMRLHFIGVWRNKGQYPSLPGGSDWNPANLPANSGQPLPWNQAAIGWTDFSFPPEGALRLRYQFTSAPQTLVIQAFGSMPGLDGNYSYSETYSGDTLVSINEVPEF